MMALAPVPQANQTLAQTQNPILQNFNQIDAQFNVDHFAFNSGAGVQGCHIKSTYLVQGAAASVAGGSIISCVTSLLTGQPELTITKQTGSTAPASAQVAEFTSSNYAGNGYTRLPSGILLRWGDSGLITGMLGGTTFNITNIANANFAN